MFADDEWAVTQAQIDAAVKAINLALDQLEDAKTAATTEALEAAVHRQLMSDVPYGVLLSGGLDVLRRHRDRRRGDSGRRRIHS